MMKNLLFQKHYHLHGPVVIQYIYIYIYIINGHTYQGPWFKGNSQLSFADPFTLVECWRNYFNNQIINVAHNLWKNYHGKHI